MVDHPQDGPLAREAQGFEAEEDDELRLVYRIIQTLAKTRVWTVFHWRMHEAGPARQEAAQEIFGAVRATLEGEALADIHEVRE